MIHEPLMATEPSSVTTSKAEAGALAVHFLAVAALLYVMISLAQRSWDRFAYLLREDGAFETLTAGFLFLSCGLCHLLATGLRRRGQPKVAWWIWTAASLFFFAGMEEISWGQRLLGISTPDALSAVNRQKELNLHNIGGFQGTNEIRVFLIASVYGAFSGIVFAWANRRRARSSRLAAFCDRARLFVVPVRYAPYFLQMLVYVMLRRQDSAFLQAFPEKRLIKELMEFLFVLGCYLTLLYRLRTELGSSSFGRRRLAPAVVRRG
jgi:hypothetical protein